MSYSHKEQIKEKKNTITLTKNKERLIFILHKKTSLANINLPITYAKFMIYLNEKFLMYFDNRSLSDDLELFVNFFLTPDPKPWWNLWVTLP